MDNGRVADNRLLSAPLRQREERPAIVGSAVDKGAVSHGEIAPGDYEIIGAAFALRQRQVVERQAGGRLYIEKGVLVVAADAVARAFNRDAGCEFWRVFCQGRVQAQRDRVRAAASCAAAGGCVVLGRLQGVADAASGVDCDVGCVSGLGQGKGKNDRSQANAGSAGGVVSGQPTSSTPPPPRAQSRKDSSKAKNSDHRPIVR